MYEPGELASTEPLQGLIEILYNEPECEVRYYYQEGTSIDAPLAEAIRRREILIKKYEQRFFRNPDGIRRDPWLRRLFRDTSPNCGSISSRRSQAQCWRYQRASACTSEDVAQVHSGDNRSRSADFTNLNSGNQRSAGEDEYLPTGNNIRDSARPTGGTLY